jgi:hypothetical protein
MLGYIVAADYLVDDSSHDNFTIEDLMFVE